MGTARHFNGLSNNSDYLAGPGSSESLNAISFGGWVKRDGTGDKNALAGRLFGPANGWCFYIDASNNLCLFVDGNVASVASPDLSEWSYLAITYNSFLGSNPRVLFYNGNTVSSLVQIGSGDLAGTFSELSTYGLMIGNASFGWSEIAVKAWNGYLSQVSIWNGARTLAELKDAMACGAVVQPNSAKGILEITGSSPEPAIVSNTSTTFAVSGTTVTSGANVGCSFTPPVGSVGLGSQLIVCM